VPVVLLSADYRGKGSFAPDCVRLLPLIAAFERAGVDVDLLNINASLAKLSRLARRATVFVVSDTFAPGSRGAATCPKPHAFRQWLEWECIPFIGNSYRGVALSSSGSKARANQRLKACGIRVPRGFLVARTASLRPDSLCRGIGVPLIAKRTKDSGCGIGVHYITSPGDLADAVSYERSRTNGSVLVEEFVEGREFTAWIVDRNGEAECYGLMEVLKSIDYPIMDQDAKHSCRVARVTPRQPLEYPYGVLDPILTTSLRSRISRTALAAHRACSLRHYSRVDMIVRSGVPIVIDVNAMAEISEHGLGAVARHRGETLSALLRALVLSDDSMLRRPTSRC
jgi:D-alanine-D-alanine ligase